MVRTKKTAGCFVLLVLMAPYAYASGNVEYHDIASKPETGISYLRVPSENNSILDALKHQGVVNFADPSTLAAAPIKPRGAPGVAVLDYDQDGDLDLYVPNGPGAPNSLYSNQLTETGRVSFLDVAVEKGVSAVEQDSTGTCFGDIDNDGYPDLLVLGNNATPNILYKNKNGAQFVNISAGTVLESAHTNPAACSMGDVNNDGLLDIAIANTFDNWDNRGTAMSFDFDHLLEANQLFLNTGHGFLDVSVQAGIVNPSRTTWAIALVDYDLDGDVDLITADDQGPKPAAIFGGYDHGYIRIYRNDGTGSFTDVTEGGGTDRFGAWMGLAFGDLNHDGVLDIFSTNSGDYFHVFLDPFIPYEAKLGDFSTGWFLGNDSGGFSYPGVGSLIATPFGWGTAIFDYDNDGDSDIAYYGGANMGAFIGASNPGSILRNDGFGNFELDQRALANSTLHSRRNVQGMAIGDINSDGFFDMVTVSSENWSEQFPLVPYLPPEQMFGSPYDHTAYIWPVFMPIDQFGNFMWTGMEPSPGSLSIEMSGGDVSNNWVKVTLKGSVGLIDGARANRDGIGAVLKFTPFKGKTAIHPVLGGSSYASQNSLEWIFGLGQSERGELEIIWSGGHRNKLYDVSSAEELILPELPCGFDDISLSFKEYKGCVQDSLKALSKHGVVDRKMKQRLFTSAVRAFHEVRR